MGTDIHFFVEILEGDTWVSEDYWEYDMEYQRWYTARDSEYYNDRDYDLFAYLAGVRNSDYQPLDRPRGLPRDVSPEVLRCAKGMDADGHSHSWFRLDELLAVNWINPKGSTLNWRIPVEFMETLEKLKELGDPDRVRIIFWFDN